MYDRLGFQSLPYPLYEIPPPTERLSTLDFLPVMRTLLEHTHGLAGTIYAAAVHPEACQQDVQQALFVLKEYLESARMLFARWEEAAYPGPTVHECRCGQEDTRAASPESG